MDPLIGAAWLLTGAVIGAVVMLLVGPARAARESQRARDALADSQQRRALEKLREDNRELEARVERQEQRHLRSIEALKRSHAGEIADLEEDLKQERAKLRALVEASSQGHVISGTSFEPTRFDEN
ncbi:hypothetical protein KAK07_19760 [Ideonella sp. 4Y16]|uniref:Uncharacterized protein n=1 Tax=Ideonella alba TaxID=2824118 RepID=A0A940YFF2_9BURK|nr:hypothetical protein [Ideonella alba]MBQ0933188.1 hypothetical protein [Ideonella alba]MBQ0945586.1 hypothetical protein [Ideonella alba]